MCPSILLSVCSNYIYPYNSVKGMYLVVGGGGDELEGTCIVWDNNSYRAL